MKNVLLLGDSIRMNYQDNVVKLLEGKANVNFPAENCRFAAYTLNSLNTWLNSFEKSDIIHWNNGIWDACSCGGETRPFSTLDEYMGYCKRIIAILKNTGAHIIFASTTPMKSNSSTIYIDPYNLAVKDYIKDKNIDYDDLYSVVKENVDTYICEDNCHLSEAGKLACAQSVVRSVEKYLN